MIGLCTCGKCGKTFKYNRNGCSKILCTACRQKSRADRVKRKALEYLGNKCSVCGYDKCDAALEFHHLDPSIKELGIGGNYNLSWKRIELELDKCVLLCSNCHRELHNDRIN